MAKVKWENFNEQITDLYRAFRKECGEMGVEECHAEWKKMLNVFSDDTWLTLTNTRYNLECLKELLEFLEELAQDDKPTTKE